MTMKTSFYNKGDRVRIMIDHPRLRVRKGEVYECLDRSLKGHIEIRHGLTGERIQIRTRAVELVTEVTPQPVAAPSYVNVAPGTARKAWLIAVLDGDQPLPASRPKLYESEKQAHAVAKSMAERHRGQTFVVFEATGFVHLPLVVSTEVVKL
jgi:hypothetical protein